MPEPAAGVTAVRTATLTATRASSGSAAGRQRAAGRPVVRQVGEVAAAEQPQGQRGRHGDPGQADHQPDDQRPGLRGAGEQAPPGQERLARQGEAHGHRQRQQLQQLEHQREQRRQHQPHRRAAERDRAEQPHRGERQRRDQHVAQASSTSAARVARRDQLAGEPDERPVAGRGQAADRARRGRSPTTISAITVLLASALATKIRRGERTAITRCRQCRAGPRRRRRRPPPAPSAAAAPRCSRS